MPLATRIENALISYVSYLGMFLYPANLVTPFQYVQLIGSALVGYFLFSTLPDLFTWIGAAVIICSGLYIGWTQTRR